VCLWYTVEVLLSYRCSQLGLNVNFEGILYVMLKLIGIFSVLLFSALMQSIGYMKYGVNRVIQNTSHTPNRAKHFDIWSTFLRHHNEE